MFFFYHFVPRILSFPIKVDRKYKIVSPRRHKVRAENRTGFAAHQKAPVKALAFIFMFVCLSEQIRVRTGTNKMQYKAVAYYTVNKQPIRLYMALTRSLILLGIRKRMVAVLFRKRLLRSKHSYDFFQLRNVATPFTASL